MISSFAISSRMLLTPTRPASSRSVLMTARRRCFLVDVARIGRLEQSVEPRTSEGRELGVDLFKEALFISAHGGTHDTLDAVGHRRFERSTSALRFERRRKVFSIPAFGHGVIAQPRRQLLGIDARRLTKAEERANLRALAFCCAFLQRIGARRVKRELRGDLLDGVAGDLRQRRWKTAEGREVFQEQGKP